MRLGPEAAARVEAKTADVEGYNHKMFVYSGVTMELAAIRDETVIFDEGEVFSASAIYAGILFGVAEMNRQRNAHEPPVLEPSITYIEGVAYPLA